MGTRVLFCSYRSSWTDAKSVALRRIEKNENRMTWWP